MLHRPYPLALMMAMALPGAAQALSLGEIRVDSALNEPLSAQIAILGATREELAGLTVAVPDREFFRRHGADRPTFLSSATFHLGLDRFGQPVLNVRSSDPFTEPLITFWVEFRWGRSALMREYSLLLDPASLTSSKPALDVAPPLALSAPAVPAPMPVQASAMPARIVASPAAASIPASASNRRTHRVSAGETLRQIVRDTGVRTEPQIQRMMIALFRANPDAFEGNINRLRSNVVLEIPAAETVEAIGLDEARREVRAQMTEWRLAGRSRASQPSIDKETADEAPQNAALENRVQTLELALADIHAQLAGKQAMIAALKSRTTAATPIAPRPNSPAEPVHAIRADQAKASPATTTVSAQFLSAPSLGRPAWISLGLLAIGLLAGYAFRRRASSTARTRPVCADRSLQEPPVTANDEAHAAGAVPISVHAPAESSIATPEASTAGAPTSANNFEDTYIAELEVDAEALERSYIESMVLDPQMIDAALQNGAVLDATMAETKKLPVRAVDTIALDYNLLDLDRTAEHVHMPSTLTDRAQFTERRANIVDVLKAAIERDPSRADLGMKLLETYFTEASTNQRAFLEIVRNLSRDRASLTPEDWKKVHAMGRRIAADDPLFAEHSEAGDLADCA